MYTYKPNEVSVIYGTVIVPDFESISIEMDEDGWGFNAGSSGEDSRTKNSNRRATVTISLDQTKPINAQLSALFEADSLLQLTVKDNSGQSLHFMPKGTILRIPGVNYAKSESGTRDWQIKGQMAINHIGGNA